MIEQTGRVVAAEPGLARVRIEPVGTCGTCAGGAGCGAATLVRAFGGRREVHAGNTVGARPGDAVTLGVRREAVLRAACVMYGVPLGLLFAAALAGEAASWGRWDGSELPTIIGALLGLGAGLGWAQYYGRRASDDPAWQPVILRIEPS